MKVFIHNTKEHYGRRPWLGFGYVETRDMCSASTLLWRREAACWSAVNKLHDMEKLGE